MLNHLQPLILKGSARDLERTLAFLVDEMPTMPLVKRQLLDYQMAALFCLAQQYDRPAARMLEIGSGRGGSGYMLASAAPQAQIISLTVDPVGASTAASLWQLHRLPNIRAVVKTSWDYLEEHPPGMLIDLIFVDGDHNQIARDLPWFNQLKVGGLMVFHDYSPADSPRPSAICHAALDQMAATLGRPFDVRIVDDQKTGMVGFYRREGESWPA